jgi:hypothetical protein
MDRTYAELFMSTVLVQTFTLLVLILLLSLSTLLLSILVEESLPQQSETLVHTSLSALKALDHVVGASETVDVNTKTGVDRVVETEDDGQESLDTFHGVLLWFGTLFGDGDGSCVCR